MCFSRNYFSVHVEPLNNPCKPCNPCKSGAIRYLTTLLCRRYSPVVGVMNNKAGQDLQVPKRGQCVVLRAYDRAFQHFGGLGRSAIERSDHPGFAGQSMQATASQTVGQPSVTTSFMQNVSVISQRSGLAVTAGKPMGILADPTTCVCGVCRPSLQPIERGHPGGGNSRPQPSAGKPRTRLTLEIAGPAKI
jgi:hypothetical protein